MIEWARGNILEAKVEALVNPVNTSGVMGKGLALQFKRAYPANFEAYARACKAKQVRLGRVFAFDTGGPGLPRYILNFPTKGHWRSASRLEDVREGLEDLLAQARRLKLGSLALPPLGCGLGGLDWAEVRPLVEAALGTEPGLRALVFAPGG
jgi:O-acetyl-ADP-ribose deacetylase (regulator of RNase III)